MSGDSGKCLSGLDFSVRIVLGVAINGYERQADMDIKPWTVISSTPDKSYRVFSLRTDRARSPRTGVAHDFFVLESAPWVNIIPLTPDEQVVMVYQYRHGTRDITLEIPGGLVEAGDSPEAAAHRELREETGYQAGSMTSLGFVHPNPAIQTNICHTFLARDVFPGGVQEQDEREDIGVVLIPLAEIPHLIRKGTISHALVIVAFHKLSLLEL
jgi:8-oxo-dGTP pyrophosphatase MutT (NUDIX family)